MQSRLDIASELDRLYTARDRVAFSGNSLVVAQRLFPSAVITWHEVTKTPAHQTQHFCHDKRATPDVKAAWKRFSLESPVVRYYLSGGDDPVISTQELVSDPELRNTGLYAECWRPFGVKYQIGLRLLRPGGVLGLSIKRDRPFSSHDSELLRSLYPHFRRAWQRANASQSTREAPSSLVELTPRENEVLCWVSQGKRDAEIATILGIADKTVSKHVERILEKLGVETRTAAANVAAERTQAERW